MLTQQIDTAIKQIIPAEQAWHYLVVPKALVGNTLELYISESNNSIFVHEELEMLLGKSLSFIQVTEEEMLSLLSKVYRKNSNSQITQYRVDGERKDFLSLIIDEACVLNSSDIHIEVYEDRGRVRFRIDGKLLEKYVLSKNDYPSLVNKIKIKANLDISEKRLPQDGRILYDHGGKFDIRVSVLPSMYGEKIVLRLLKKDAANLDIEKLGLLPDQLLHYQTGIKKTNGIILISGPTGSGKTTTLYATLKILNDHVRNILTIEDPVEYTLDGVNQVQLKEDIGFTFARALRTFLRQDPDIIMLGEIRDKDTAQMAIRASLTGHLVLSTIHTNSAWEIINRLQDMGIPGYLLASTLNLAVAQRLVRLLCPECKKKVSFDKNSILTPISVNINLTHVYIAIGCPSCHYTGYSGRKAIYEVIPIDTELIQLIRKGVSEIDEYLLQKNIKKLADIALVLLERGDTSVDEVLPLLIS